MNKIDEVPEIDDFLAGSLVTWFASCLELITDEKLTYDSLVNGYLIHNVFLQMNLQVHDDNVYPSMIDSVSWRSRNLLAVLTNIRHFYEDKLDQVILRLPDVEKLGREPEHHVREVEILLELLLGCAVQCPKKQGFIEKITKLHEAIQLDIAEYISQVIAVPGIVLSSEMFVDFTSIQKAINCVRQICHERDEYKTQVLRYRELEDKQPSDDLCEKLQLQFKAKSLEAQLLQKSDELDEAKDKLEEYEKELRGLTKIHEKLAFEAKNANYYRDELDAATESAEKAKRLEQEIARYQKKLADFDYCKVQLKELEKSNKILTESKAELLKQLSSQKAEIGKTRDLKKQVTKLKEQLNNLTVENDENRDKYWTVCEEKTELQRLVKESFKQSHQSEGIPSLKDDLLLNHANSQIAKLQANNQSLIEKLNQTLFEKSSEISTLMQNNNKLLQDNKKLLQKIDTLNMKYDREFNRSKTLGYTCNAALMEAKKLQQQELGYLKSQLEKAHQSSSDKTVLKIDIPKISMYDPFSVESKNTVVRSQREKAQQFDPSASDKNVPKNKSWAPKPNYNVDRSRKLLKYVKPQS